MTKEDIIGLVWNSTKLNKKQSVDVVENLLGGIKDALKSDSKLKVGGFGVFEVRHRKPRVGRNPKTRVPAKIKAGKTLKFKPSKALKTRIAKETPLTKN